VEIVSDFVLQFFSFIFGGGERDKGDGHVKIQNVY
jgi:hypothetical protein